MATKLLDLGDRIVLDTGQVVPGYHRLIQNLLSNEPLGDTVWARNNVEIRDVNRFNQHHDQSELKLFELGSPESPAEACYEWNLPKGYRDLDIPDLAHTGLRQLGLTDQDYRDRLDRELDLMYRRKMFDFVRALVYIRDEFVKNNIVYGVGRGSSCASLVMFALRINRIDPVLYEIPIEEFYK